MCDVCLMLVAGLVVLKVDKTSPYTNMYRRKKKVSLIYMYVCVYLYLF